MFILSLDKVSIKMLVPKLKPTLILLGGFFFINMLQGCNSIPLQSDSLLEALPVEFIKPQELLTIGFNPQRDYECGPAALATSLQWRGINVTSEQLVPEIYLPQRKGSLQIELLAATRRYGLIPYVIDKKMSALLKEIKAGNPVLVLQNLALEWYPKWHYAVVIGYDLNKDEIILRSGEMKRHVNSFSLFERTWRRARYWGFVIMNNDSLPASANAFSYLTSVMPLEKIKGVNFSLKAYKTALNKWPDENNLLMAAGNASYSTGDKKAAEKYYRKVIKLAPKYAPALNNLAQVLYENKLYAEAEEKVLQAIQINDNYVKKYNKTLLNIREAIKKAKN